MLHERSVSRHGRATARLVIAALTACLWACDDEDPPVDAGTADAKDSGHEPMPPSGGSGPSKPPTTTEDSGAPDAGRADSGTHVDAGDDPEPSHPDAGIDAGPERPVFGGLEVDVDPERHDIDLFGDARARARPSRTT